jgi:hypothetical protein
MIMSDVEDLKEILDLVKDLRLPDEDRNKQAEILMKIAEKLKPYISQISKPVSLAWGIACEGEEWYRFTPDSIYRISDLSSGEGVILWSPSGGAGDKFWLLSSGKFLYIRTLQYNTGGGIGWSHESWIGEPIESDDPSKLPQVLEEIVCDNLMNAVLKILATVSEIDE